MSQPCRPETVPHLARTLVPRRRLWGELDQATAEALTLLVAPAGSGKTFGVSGWLHDRSLDGECLWTTGRADVDADALDRLLDQARLGASVAPLLLVVDEAHLLPADVIARLEHLVHQEPATIRVLLMARWDLPISRLVPELVGDLTMLRGDLLRLDAEESRELIVTHARTDDPRVIAGIGARADGWAAATVLLARAVAVAPDPVEAATTYRPSGGGLAGDIAADVFAGLTDEERHLLLCLSDPEVVTADEAGRLSGDANAGTVLDGLVATGVLMTRQRLDVPDEPEAPSTIAYRIHPLLREIARQHMVAGGAGSDRARGAVRQATEHDVLKGHPVSGLFRLAGMGLTQDAAALLPAVGLEVLSRGDARGLHRFVVRHSDVLDTRPETWLTAAYACWVAGDTAAGLRWLDLIADTSAGVLDAVDLAAARLFRACISPGDPAESLEDGLGVLAALRPRRGNRTGHVLLMLWIGCACNWVGRYADAEHHLAEVMSWADNADLPFLADLAKSHLALTEFMGGSESVGLRIAEEVLADRRPGSPFDTHTRAALAAELCRRRIAPWPLREQPTTPAIDQDTLAARSDPLTRHLTRSHAVLRRLMSGDVEEARRQHATPLDLPPLSRPVALSHLLDAAELAYLADDRDGLAELRDVALDLEAMGEAAFLDAWLAEINGDSATAVTRYDAAAHYCELVQPPLRATALAARAQLLDALDESEAALEALREAVALTQVRRCGYPFAGFSRLGTPIHPMLARLAGLSRSAWLDELVAGTAGHAGMAPALGPRTASPQERDVASGHHLATTLTAREREVLNELARGATYADIATRLVLSENTVKTHVSSLYAKLTVGRRSEALAVARTMGLL